jgi:hypothetical protein
MPNSPGFTNDTHGFDTVPTPFLRCSMVTITTTQAGFGPLTIIKGGHDRSYGSECDPIPPLTLHWYPLLCPSFTYKHYIKANTAPPQLFIDQ